MKKPVVCYITKDGRHYLSHYHYDKQKAQEEVNWLNTAKPTAYEYEKNIDWNNIIRFYVDEQEEMY